MQEINTTAEDAAVVAHSVSYLYSLKTRLMSDRIARLQAFLEQSPNDLFLNHALALEYIKEGRDADARAVFEQNRVYDAAYVPTYYHLGKLLERKGQTDEAIKIYEAGMAVARAANDNHAYNELQGAYEDLVY
jgi:tetratricopeptide (TPR) repeat protein